MAAFFVTVFVTIVPCIVQAQIEKRIVFTKARTTFTLRGKLPRQTADYDAYVFRARKGQTISVKLTTADRDASFSIFETKVLGPEDDMIFPPNEMSRLYTGKLPVTGEYAVQVYGKAFATDEPGSGSGAAYTIEISLR